VGNKKELSALDALLEEVIKSDAASSTMKHDAQTFFALLRADTMPVPEVRAAIGVLDELMRNKQLNHWICLVSLFWFSTAETGCGWPIESQNTIWKTARGIFSLLS